MAKSEGSQGYKGKLACVELTNYHFLNRELVTNEQCSNAAQHLDRYHKTYEHCIVRKRRKRNYSVDVHVNAVLSRKK